MAFVEPFSQRLFWLIFSFGKDFVLNSALQIVFNCDLTGRYLIFYVNISISGLQNSDQVFS